VSFDVLDKARWRKKDLNQIAQREEERKKSLNGVEAMEERRPDPSIERKKEEKRLWKGGLLSGEMKLFCETGKVFDGEKGGGEIASQGER